MIRATFFLLLLLASFLCAQDAPPLDSPPPDIDIPVLDDPVKPPPAKKGDAKQPSSLPGTNGQPPVDKPIKDVSPKNKEADSKPVPTDVEPRPPTSLNGRPVPSPAEKFMGDFHVEAIFSSRSWKDDWCSYDLGLLRVTTLGGHVSFPHGGLLQWQRDALGNPMVQLRARVPFPRLKQPDPLSREQPLTTSYVIITQAVVFYPRPDGWLASASPLYVTMEEEGKVYVLVPLQRGQGIWRAMVGNGGIYVENFIGAGLQAARTELFQYFRDEEIRLFTYNNGDVNFYLRPNHW